MLSPPWSCIIQRPLASLDDNVQGLKAKSATTPSYTAPCIDNLGLKGAQKGIKLSTQCKYYESRFSWEGTQLGNLIVWDPVQMSYWYLTITYESQGWGPQPHFVHNPLGHTSLLLPLQISSINHAIWRAISEHQFYKHICIYVYIWNNHSNST